MSRAKFERYYSSAWEWECCGGPVHVGDHVTLSVRRDTEFATAMRDELAESLPQPLTGVEVHHDEDVEQVDGIVRALDAVIGDTRPAGEPRGRPARSEKRKRGHTRVGPAADAQPIFEPILVTPVSVIPDGTATVDGLSEPTDVEGHLEGYVITIER